MARSHDLWLVGRLGRPVGLRGECVFHAASDRPGDLDHVASAPVRLTPPEGDPTTSPAVAWLSLRRHSDRAIAQFEGIDSREAAAERTHWEVWVDPGDLEPLQVEGRWWVDDLVGCAVIRAGGEALGEVVAVISGAADDLLEVSRPGQPSARIPLNEAFVQEVNTEEKIIRVDLPEGLIDD